MEQAKRLAAAKGEANRPAHDATLDEGAQRYWLEHGQFKKSAKDIDQRIATAVALIGPKTPMKEIDADVMARAIQRRRGKLAYGKKVATNSTVNRDMIDTTMRPILNMARKVWKIPGVQEIDWKKLRLEEPSPQPMDFSSSEMGALDESLQPHWHDFRRFQSRYALRAGEMFFPLSSIDLEGRRLWVMRTVRKNKRLLAIPLMDDDVSMLAARIGRARAAKIDTVWFRGTSRGYLRALNYRQALRAFSSAMTDSGLRAAKGARGTHALRHHGGMQMLRATGNLRTVQKLLGHSSIQSTLTYAHALEGDVRAGLEAVSRLAPEPAKTEGPESQEIQRDVG